MNQIMKEMTIFLEELEKDRLHVDICLEKLFGLDKLIFLDKAEKTEISVYLRSLEFGVYPNRHIPSDFETITCLLKHFENVTGMKKYFLKYKENYDVNDKTVTLSTFLNRIDKLKVDKMIKQ